MLQKQHINSKQLLMKAFLPKALKESNRC